MAPRWRRTGAAVAVALYLCACLNSIIIQAIGLRGDPAGVAIVRRLVNGAAGSSGRRSAGAVAVGRSLAQQAPGPVVAKRLVATDGKADSWFGGSVAMSLDGLTLAVGAWADDVNGVEDQGSVYIYTRPSLLSSEWSQSAKCVAIDGAEDDYFGSVALSGDGRTLLVGAYAVTVNSNVKQGAAYVFRRSAAGAWAQEAKLLASDGVAGDSFGYFVTLSLDGNTALVSSFGDDAPLGSGNGRGSAFHVFTRFGDSVPGLPSPWLPTFKITALDGTSTDWFGGSASMSADGLNVAIGAGDENNGANLRQGSWYFYKRPDVTSSTWTAAVKKISADGQAGDRYGVSTAMDAASLTLVVGAYRAAVGGVTEAGKAYVYTRETADGGFWEQAFILTAPDGQPFDRYGGAVALSADGYTAMVGSRAYWTGIVNTDGSSASNVTNGRPGKAYVYRRTSQLGNDWELIAVLTGGLDMSSNLVDEFGYSLKLSADGDVALVGARKAAVDGAQQQGAAYVFSNLLQATDLETNFPPPPPPPPSVPIPPSVLGSQQSPPPPSTTGPVNSSPSPVPRGDMPPPAPPSSSGSSTVGIAVGVAIGVAAAIAIGVGIFFCIKKSQASSGAKYSVPQNEDDYGKPITQATNASPPPRPQQASYAPPATAPAADGKV